jgi:aryl-alcohol dehydrogenase-like predicted oxidoreductase
MKTIALGFTKIPVSCLCLGAMYFGTRNDDASSFRLLDIYKEAGGFFIDTANIYSHWVQGYRGYESEMLLGRWIKARKNRPSLFIATKVGFEIPFYGVRRELQAATIVQECEKSLRNLGVETIDLFYAHCDDLNTPLDESLNAFDQLIQSGKVRAIGASNYMAWRLEEAHWTSRVNGWNEFCCVQQRYTYLRPKPGASFSPQVSANEDLLQYCRCHPITLLAYAVLLGGAYSRNDREIPAQYRGTDSQVRLAAIQKVAGERGITINQVILAWMLQSEPFVLPLIAASTEEQLRENIQALDVSLSLEEMKFLNDAAG